MDQFTQLVKAVRRCTICAPYLKHGVRPIIQISPTAKILIAGQAPGLKVHESGVPFQDASGERLRDWLGVRQDVFYDAHKIAILPMGFCYPGTGPHGDLPPRKECAPAWRADLLAQLPQLELTLVIGQYAQAYHLPATQNSKRTVTAAVKAWRDGWPSVMPLPHPSPRNNIWLKKNPWFEQELLPVLRKRIKALLAE